MTKVVRKRVPQKEMLPEEFFKTGGEEAVDGCEALWNGVKNA